MESDRQWVGYTSEGMSAHVYRGMGFVIHWPQRPGKGTELLAQEEETLIEGPLHPGTVLGILHKSSPLILKITLNIPIL